MSRIRLLVVLTLVAFIGAATPIAAAPLAAAPLHDDDDDDRRGRRGAQREAEQQRREAERAIERAQRQIERAQEEAQRAQREAQRQAERAAREAQHNLALIQWDGGRPWSERVLEVPVAAQPITVSVLLPQATPPSFVPNFANRVQSQVLPALVQFVPPEAFPQAPLQFWQLQPNAFMLAHPALFWGPDDHWGAEQLAAQVPMPGFQPVVMNGPLGYGTYLLLFLG
jgi:hypothetical protein